MPINRFSRFYIILLIACCLFSFQFLQAQVTINASGGISTTTKDLKIMIGAGGQLQVQQSNTNQIFSSTGKPTADPVANLYNGVYLVVGNTIFGSPNGAAGAAGVITPFVTVSHNGGSASGSGSSTLVLKATSGNLDYLVTLTYDYIYPNSFFNIQYKVDIPNGNTQIVKIYHTIETKIPIIVL